MAELEEKVKNIIAKELGVEMEKLTDDASFMEDLGADSSNAPPADTAVIEPR